MMSMNSRQSLALLGVVMLIASAFGAWWFSQPSVQLQDDSYEIAIALYGACNRRSTAQVESLDEALQEKVAQEQISPEAAASLRRIIELANASKWVRASEACRDLLDAQVRQ